MSYSRAVLAIWFLLFMGYLVKPVGRAVIYVTDMGHTGGFGFTAGAAALLAGNDLGLCLRKGGTDYLVAGALTVAVLAWWVTGPLLAAWRKIEAHKSCDHKVLAPPVVWMFMAILQGTIVLDIPRMLTGDPAELVSAFARYLMSVGMFVMYHQTPGPRLRDQLRQWRTAVSEFLAPQPGLVPA